VLTVKLTEPLSGNGLVRENWYLVAVSWTNPEMVHVEPVVLVPARVIAFSLNPVTSSEKLIVY
jgi:hypothetical protein